jgi:hypothetical protein
MSRRAFFCCSRTAELSCGIRAIPFEAPMILDFAVETNSLILQYVIDSLPRCDGCACQAYLFHFGDVSRP